MAISKTTLSLLTACLSLFEATGEFEWFEAARTLARKMIDEFWDETDGGFFFTGKSHEELIVRSKDYFDNATPPAIRWPRTCLLRLGLLTGEADYARHAVTVFRLTAGAIQRYPAAFGRALGALDFYLSAPKEIVILGDRESPDTIALRREVWKPFLPNKVVVQSSAVEKQLERTIPAARAGLS